MASEFESKYPDIISPNLKQELHKDQFYFNAGDMNKFEIERATQIVECAKKIVPVVCGLENKDGVAIAITKRAKNAPILVVQIGEINDPDPSYGDGGKKDKYSEFAKEKAKVLQENPTFVSSGENTIKLSSGGILIPAGAVAFGEWIISTSAFKNAKMDAATTIAIATGAGLIGVDEAEKLASNPKINCVTEFMPNEDKFLEPIYH